MSPPKIYLLFPRMRQCRSWSSSESLVQTVFQRLASVLTTWYQVFHRILDLKHGLDFYPGLCFYEKLKTENLKIKPSEVKSQRSEVKDKSPLTSDR